MALNKQPPLGKLSQTMSRMGRFGDTTLVHMNPAEVRGLSSLGKLSYNPVTGLPEAFAFLPMLAAAGMGAAKWGAIPMALGMFGASAVSNKLKTGKWNPGRAGMGALMGLVGGQFLKGAFADDFTKGLMDLETPLGDIASGTTPLTGGTQGSPAGASWLGDLGKKASGYVGGDSSRIAGALGEAGIAGLTGVIGEEPLPLGAVASRKTPPVQRYARTPLQQTKPLPGETTEEFQERIGGGDTFFEQSAYYPVAKGGSLDKAYEGYVGGDGHGMEDNQMFKIKGGGLAALSPKEYVVPADVMASMGNGNPDDGADAMDDFISGVRKEKYGRDKQPPEMDARKQLQKLA